MLSITNYLLKLGYNIQVKNNNYIISKNNKQLEIPQKDFEKLLFVKLIDLIDELIYEENNNDK